ncbi:pseudouridine synthase [Martiniozyma asiatica (nom. inval.)]|nr:pseudouridine synthase [Martiniozyma asiatica]
MSETGEKRKGDILQEQEPDNKKIKIDENEVKVNGITELDVGITKFICHGDSNVRICGHIKQRYTDFLVNEIDLDGNVIHLNDTGFTIKPKTKEEKENERKQLQEQEQKKREEFKVDEDLRKQMVELFGEEHTENICNLVKDGGKTYQVDKTFDDKEERTKIHKLIREAFGNHIESVTTPTNSFIFGANANKNRKRRQDVNSVQPIEHNLGPRKKSLEFVLYKENKETMEIASIIARMLRIQVKNIHYAGTKDRRGVTCQRMSVDNMPVERVTMLNNALRGCRLGGFSYSDESIRLGSLKGNEFIVTIKDAKSTNPEFSVQDAIIPILDKLKSQGFINYYGMQRFGTFSVSTHQIGKELLKSNWKEAANLILGEQEICIPGSQEARKIWAETKDPSKAIKKMPRKCNAEFAILSRLERQNKKEGESDYDNGAYYYGISGIARNLRAMYGHSYQSYVWNVVTSKRIELFGTNVVAGDLVLLNNPKIVGPDGDKPQLNEDGILEDVKEVHIQARPITEEEITQGKFDIFDVVLPTPGFDILYPENEELKQVYVETMKKDGLNPFDMFRPVKEFALAGSYRHIVAKMDNLEYWFRKYNDGTEELVRTDLQLLEASKKGEKLERVTDGVPNGKKTAVVLKMQLGTSTYATMALREILQGDTSRFGGVVNLKTN